MRTIKYPERSEWEALCRRPEISRTDLEAVAGGIIERVRQEGDQALFNYSFKFDGVKLQSLKVSDEEMSEALSLVSEDLKKAIAVAFANIEKFQRSQLSAESVTEN